MCVFNKLNTSARERHVDSIMRRDQRLCCDFKSAKARKALKSCVCRETNARLIEII